MVAADLALIAIRSDSLFNFEGRYVSRRKGQRQCTAFSLATEPIGRIGVSPCSRDRSSVTAQLTLFDTHQTGPSGLRYQSDFISSDEENELVSHIRKLPLVPFQFGAFTGNRRVAWFGWHYDYSIQKLQPAEAIPDWLDPFIARIEAFANLPHAAVRQVLCTEYAKGVGIGWHRDKPHFDHIFGLSLASACKFRFRRKSGSTWQRFTLTAAPRSLYMMSGDARHLWEHSIPPVEAPRFSITFRTMVAKPKSTKHAD